jgi:hypothetical protein
MSTRPGHLPNLDLDVSLPARRDPRSVLHAVFPLELDRLHTGDCLKLFPMLKTGTIDLIFAHPSFNIGYDYDIYDD